MIYELEIIVKNLEQMRKIIVKISKDRENLNKIVKWFVRSVSEKECLAKNF